MGRLFEKLHLNGETVVVKLHITQLLNNDPFSFTKLCMEKLLRVLSAKLISLFLIDFNLAKLDIRNDVSLSGRKAVVKLVISIFSSC